VAPQFQTKAAAEAPVSAAAFARRFLSWSGIGLRPDGGERAVMAESRSTWGAQGSAAAALAFSGLYLRRRRRRFELGTAIVPRLSSTAEPDQWSTGGIFGEGLVWQEELLTSSEAFFTSTSDLKCREALAIEIRSDVLRAAVVQAEGGALEEAAVVSEPVRLCEGSPAENAATLQAALKSVVEQFKWKGVIGCSVTKKVTRLLGVSDVSFLEIARGVGDVVKKALTSSVLHVSTMAQTIAAGYTELAYGGGNLQGSTLVVTVGVDLGIDLGAALYNRGCRVQNASLNTTVTSRWKDDFAEVRARHPDAWVASDGSWAFAAPPAGTPAFASLVALLDRYLLQLLGMAGEPDRLVILRTGNLADGQGYLEKVLPELTQTKAASAEWGCEILLRSGPGDQSQAEAAPYILRGAAAGALYELRAASALQEVAAALRGPGVPKSLQTLSMVQIRAAFDALDRSGDGTLQLQELSRGLDMLGIAAEPEGVLREMSRRQRDTVDFDEFVAWWRSEVIESPVVIITSVAELRRILAERAPEARTKPSLLVLEVVTTFCRSCRQFGPKYKRLAHEHADARFLQLVGNSNVDTMDLIRNELGVRRTPSFFVYDRSNGKAIDSWSSSRVELFEDRLRQCFEVVGLPRQPPCENKA